MLSRRRWHFTQSEWWRHQRP